MKRHVIRLVVLTLSAAILIAGSPNLASAGILLAEGHGWAIVEPRAQEYLLAGHSAIESVGSGVIEISGTTIATQEVERIAVTLYLEEYNTAVGAWQTVEVWPFVEMSADSIESDEVVSVESGKTYRIRACHEVWNRGIHESGWSVTSGITAR